MSKLTYIKKLFRCLVVPLAFVIASMNVSAAPLSGPLAITLNTYFPPKVTLWAGTDTIVQYKIQNTTNKQTTFTLKNIPGVPDGTIYANNGNYLCKINTGVNPTVSPYTVSLSQGQSCIYELKIKWGYILTPLKALPTFTSPGLADSTPDTNNQLDLTLPYPPDINITTSPTVNGLINPLLGAKIYSGFDLTFTATPSWGYNLSAWLVDGVVVQAGGNTFTLKNNRAPHVVTARFSPPGRYIGTQSGRVFYSTDSGVSWSPTSNPPDSLLTSVNAVFEAGDILYVATESNAVRYSSNNGSTWTATSATPNSSAVRSLFVASDNTLYIGTAAGVIYSSTNKGVSWTALGTNPSGANSVNSLFVLNNNKYYVGSADGKVYYSTDKNNWTAYPNTPDGGAIRGVFVANNKLYINTENQWLYTNPNLAGGGSWSSIAQTVYRFFVNSSANKTYAGTNRGYLYSLDSGSSLSYITDSPINALYFRD